MWNKYIHTRVLIFCFILIYFIVAGLLLLERRCAWVWCCRAGKLPVATTSLLVRRREEGGGIRRSFTFTQKASLPSLPFELTTLLPFSPPLPPSFPPSFL